MLVMASAGAATAVGAAVVFFPSLVKLASRRVLAGSLGLSAGVMTYVSFVEIFMKSVGGFIDSGIDEDMSYIYATLSFFGGVLTMMVSLEILPLDVITHLYFIAHHFFPFSHSLLAPIRTTPASRSSSQMPQW